MADPGYPCNRQLVRLLGGVVRPVAVGAGTGYQLALEHLQEAWRPDVRVVMVATPSNPTGTLIGSESLARLHAEVRTRGASLIVDEIYQGLVYGGGDHTALTGEPEGLFVVNSFSKYFGMTGWRLGWVVAPPGCVDVLDRLAQNLYLAAPTPSQYAALAAFEPETLEVLEARRVEFERRRSYLMPALEALGFAFPVRPGGAFYLYGRCDGIGTDSDRFAADLLEREAVAVTPGRDFGDNEPGRFVRFAYTTDEGNLREGVRRIARFIGAGTA
jgi:aspartate/methionine/tyrosine aminotransferase